MRKITVTLLCAFILLFSNASFGQNLSVEKYKRDLDTLKEVLKKDHPSLYRFRTQSSINEMFDKCSRLIDSSTTDRDFYRIIKLILSGIHDGHLGCTPSDSLKKFFDDTEKCFPVTLIFIKNKAFVDCDKGGIFPRGTEIISINKEAVNTIRKNLFGYIVSDGKIKTKKYYILNHTFWFYYNLVYGSKDRYQIKYRKSNGIISERSVIAATKNNIECENLLQTKDAKLLDLKYPQKATALLTIRSFAYDDLSEAKEDFVSFIDSSFKNIEQKKIKTLIIDLRNNGGGKDIYGSLLYSYLTNRSFRYYKKLETTSKQLTEADHSNLAIQHPNLLNFKGKVYVLTNGLSFSVTTEFCAIAQSNHRAVFIGEETGGTYYGNTSGRFIDVSLPYSSVTIHIPVVKYSMSVSDIKNKDRGIIPDYQIIPTIKDLVKGNDTVLNFALKLAKEKK